MSAMKSLVYIMWGSHLYKKVFHFSYVSLGKTLFQAALLIFSFTFSFMIKMDDNVVSYRIEESKLSVSFDLITKKSRKM